MLLTVKETCFILDIKRRQLYYMLAFSQCDGAFKIFNTWRIDENYLGGIYDRLCDSGGDRRFADDSGLAGVKERVEIVRKNFISSCQRPKAPCLQGREAMVCFKNRPVGVVKGPRKLKQQELFAAGDYW